MLRVSQAFEAVTDDVYDAGVQVPLSAKTARAWIPAPRACLNRGKEMNLYNLKL